MVANEFPPPRHRPRAAWGLRGAPADNPRARRTESHWRWPTLMVLAGTTPAFYLELLRNPAPWLSSAWYLLAAAMVLLSLGHTAWHSGRAWQHLAANPLDLLLGAGLVAAALVPPSGAASWALVLRLAVALLTVLRMAWALQPLLVRGGIGYLIAAAALVLLMCGAGYWWLEPTTPSLPEGLWLAFATAATVGYGDVVPTTAASKIFSVFVVLLGFGVLTVVTAAIAARFVETEERLIEREILRDMHRRLNALHEDIEGLRKELSEARTAAKVPRSP